MEIRPDPLIYPLDPLVTTFGARMVMMHKVLYYEFWYNQTNHLPAIVRLFRVSGAENQQSIFIDFVV